MPTLHYTDEELDLPQGWDEGLDSNIRRIRREAAVARVESRALKAELDTLKRESVLFKAGVPADAKGELFAKAYEGPLDADSVKAAYEAVFGAPDPGAGQGAGTPDPNLTAEQRIAQAGGTGAGGTRVVPLEEVIRTGSLEEVRNAIRNAPPEAKIRLAGEDD